jgi:hypothetical protein
MHDHSTGLVAALGQVIQVHNCIRIITTYQVLVQDEWEEVK